MSSLLLGMSRRPWLAHGTELDASDLLAGSGVDDGVDEELERFSPFLSAMASSADSNALAQCCLPAYFPVLIRLLMNLSMMDSLALPKYTCVSATAVWCSDGCEIDIRCDAGVATTTSVASHFPNTSCLCPRGRLLDWCFLVARGHHLTTSLRPRTISSNETPLTLITLNLTPGRSPYDLPPPIPSTMTSSCSSMNDMAPSPARRQSACSRPDEGDLHRLPDPGVRLFGLDTYLSTTMPLASVLPMRGSASDACLSLVLALELALLPPELYDLPSSSV